MIDSIFDYLRTQTTPVSTRHLASKYMTDHLDLFFALNAEAKKGTLVRGMALEPNPSGVRDLLCIGWSCPIN